jgi:hypothetical protein
MFYQFLRFVLPFWLLTEDAFQYQSIKHVLVGEMNLLLDFPWFALTVRATIVIVINRLIVLVAKDPLTFFAFFGVIERYRVANRTGNELMIEE